MSDLTARFEELDRKRRKRRSIGYTVALVLLVAVVVGIAMFGDELVIWLQSFNWGTGDREYE